MLRGRLAPRILIHVLAGPVTGGDGLVERSIRFESPSWDPDPTLDPPTEHARDTPTAAGWAEFAE